MPFQEEASSNDPGGPDASGRSPLPTIQSNATRRYHPEGADVPRASERVVSTVPAAARGTGERRIRPRIMDRRLLALVSAVIAGVGAAGCGAAASTGSQPSANVPAASVVTPDPAAARTVIAADDAVAADVASPSPVSRLSEIAWRSIRFSSPVVDGVRHEPEATATAYIGVEHGTADSFLDGASAGDTRLVDVIQITAATPFIADNVSRPAGAKPPTGRSMTLIVDAASFAGLDFALLDEPPDFAPLGPSVALFTTGPAVPQVGIVVPDPAAANTVKVRGSTSHDRAVVRRILAAMGSHQRVRSVVLRNQGPAGRVPTITISSPSPPTNQRRSFETELVGQEIARELPRYVWLQIDGDGTRISRPPQRQTPPPTPEAVAASVATGAAAAHFGVRSITVFAFPIPAAETVIRFREDQLFDSTARAWTTALTTGSAGAPVSNLIFLQSPSGQPLPVYGRPLADAVPASAPAVLYRRATHLTITLHRPSIDMRPEADTVWTLDCQNRYASTFSHPRATCDHVIRDRWALFLPIAIDYTCGGGVQGASTIEIKGTFAGQPVDYSAGGCNENIVERWTDLLHVT